MMVAYQTVVELPCCCCGSVVDVVADVAVVALDAVESQCVRADVCTCVQCVGVDTGSHANLLLLLLLLLKSTCVPV